MRFGGVGVGDGAGLRGVGRTGGYDWRFCLNTKEGSAPSAFATAPGSGLELWSLRRKA